MLKFIIKFYLLVHFLLFSNPVFAVYQPAGVLDASLETFKSAFGLYYTDLVNYGLYLLSSLTIISVIVKFSALMFRGGQIADILYEILKLCLMFGLILSVLEFHLIDMSKNVFSSIETFFQKGGVPVSPSSMIDYGISGLEVCLSSVTWRDALNGSALFALIAGLIILVAMSFGALNLLIAQIIIYFYTFCGCFMLGFYPLDFTRQFAVNYINAFIASVFRYFMCIIVAVVCCDVFHSCLDNYKASLSTSTTVHVPPRNPAASLKQVMAAYDNVSISTTDGSSSYLPIATLIVCALLTYLLMEKLPNLISGLFSSSAQGMGVSASGFARATGMAAAAGTMVYAARSMAKSAGQMAGTAGLNTAKAVGSSVASGAEKAFQTVALKSGARDGGDSFRASASRLGSQFSNMFGQVGSFAGQNGLAASNAVKHLNDLGTSGKLANSGEMKLATNRAKELMSQGFNAQDAADRAIREIVRSGGGSETLSNSTQSNTISGTEKHQSITSNSDDSMAYGANKSSNLDNNSLSSLEKKYNSGNMDLDDKNNLNKQTNLRSVNDDQTYTEMKQNQSINSQDQNARSGKSTSSNQQSQSYTDQPETQTKAFAADYLNKSRSRQNGQKHKEDS